MAWGQNVQTEAKFAGVRNQCRPRLTHPLSHPAHPRHRHFRACHLRVCVCGRSEVRE